MSTDSFNAVHSMVIIQAYQKMCLLSELLPLYIILYDPDTQFVREIEVHQVGPTTISIYTHNTHKHAISAHSTRGAYVSYSTVADLTYHEDAAM